MPMVKKIEGLRLEPITFELLSNAFRAICTESSALIERVAYAPTITEGHDYSVSLLTPNARLVSHGYRDQAPHLGTFEESIKAVLKEIDDMSQGDVYIFNDPFTGGTHQLDVKFIRPIFYGEELFCFTIQLCHWPDFGGPMPGTFNPRATECYAEGLRLPPMRIFKGDEPVSSTFKLLRYNIRCAVERMAEIHAQFEAGRLVEKRLKEYMAKYGPDTVKLAMEDCMDYSEKLFRKEIESLPDGVYEFEDYGDKDVMHPEQPPIKVKCKMTIKGSDVTIDWSGCDGAPKGSWGFTRPALLSATYDGTMHCFPHLTPLNNGIIRSLNIITKPGTCVDVQEPTPSTGYCSGAYEKVDAAVMGCWAQALSSIDPTRVYAATVNLTNVVTGGVHPKTKSPFVSYLWLEGGQGARTFKDGNSFYLMIYVSGATNQPVEVHERCYPMIYRKVEAIQDSCGDGKYRGGFGMHRDFEVWGETVATIHGDRELITPYGIAGGTNGGPNIWILNKGTPKEENLGMFSVGKLLRPGDHITYGSNGGGGFGNPLQRDPRLVLEDVIDEFISLKKAREVYGVSIKVVDPDSLHYEIDWDETEEMRRELSKAQPRRGLGPWEVNPNGEKIKVRDKKTG